MKKIFFIFLGTLSLAIGIIGIFVPGLPTTAFLLLTAALYMRSSDRLYQKLISNKILGPYIHEFRKNKGMTRRMKIHAIGTMWFMITISCVFFIKPVTVILVVIGVGLIGTVVMGWIVPTAGK
ncbi:MAG: YbaN family protein [Bacteroidales bacterium]|jgi:hypothetical protein|nr:YbaN family protein [Bacteroidales bacterium]